MSQTVERVLIIGGGAQAQAVADVLLQRADRGERVDVAGFLDDDPALHGVILQERPVLGPTAAAAEFPHDALFVGIGHNLTRRRLYEYYAALGERFTSVIHPSAVLSRDLEVGPGTYIGATAVVSVCSRIGSNVLLNGTSCLGHHSIVGDHVHIGPGVSVAGNVTIGEGAMLGVGANVLPGCQIGAWSVVGGGALVREDVPDGVTVVGVPARSLRRRS